MLEVHRFVTLPMDENCYAVVNQDRQALIVDPGNQATDLITWIQDRQWQPQAILLTHAHVDHIGAVDALRQAFDLEVYLHEIEKDWLGDPQLNLSIYLPTGPISQGAADHLWTQMGPQTVGAFHFEIAHLPGHSPGSVIYSFPEEGVVLCGDTVFKGAIGRTDFPSGSMETLLAGIRRHIMTLPEDTLLYPGHGPETSVKIERDLNPFLK